jgi:uncharacterized damage-inducible protein DinB
MKETIARLLDHLVWADRTVLENLGRPPLPDEKTIGVFAHVLAAERLWIERIRGRGPSVIAVWPKLTLGECSALAAANHQALQEMLETGSAVKFSATISYASSRGGRFTNSVGDVLLHLAMHGSYHRGQVAAAVRAGGGEPVNTDFIHYMRTR